MKAKVEDLIRSNKPWYLAHPNTQNDHLDNQLLDGSRGLMPKWLVDGLMTNNDPDNLPSTIITSAQKHIIKAHLKAWRARNAILFHNPTT